MKRTTAEWVRKAEADYRLAVKISRGKEPFPDQLCFHCQQSAEKYLKALLEEQGQTIPYTHILRDLLAPAAVLSSGLALLPTRFEVLDALRRRHALSGRALQQASSASRPALVRARAGAMPHAARHQAATAANEITAAARSSSAAAAKYNRTGGGTHMPPSSVIYPASLCHWIVVRPEPSGQFTAQLLGLPELAATAVSRQEAIEQIGTRIGEWIGAGRLVSVEAPGENPLLKWFGHKDPNDPLEQEYLQDLARFRQEDLERTLREYEQEDRECSNSSSTPTT